jgi:hypothetical protein
MAQQDPTALPLQVWLSSLTTLFHFFLFKFIYKESCGWDPSPCSGARKPPASE